MALTESNLSGSRRVSVTPPSFTAGLTRLPELHAELSLTASLAGFVRSSAAAASALTVMGCLAVWTAGGAGLKQEFIWSLLMMMGVAALLRAHIRSTARAFDRVPLCEAARDLRFIVFYAGLAWGAGAFLLLGSDPLPITGLCFAVVPSVLMVLILQDRAAGLLFMAPVTVLTAAAIRTQPWADRPVALAVLLVAQGLILATFFLPARIRSLPAGLMLR